MKSAHAWLQTASAGSKTINRQPRGSSSSLSSSSSADLPQPTHRADRGARGFGENAIIREGFRTTPRAVNRAMFSQPGWRAKRCAYNVAMLGSWLIGEKDESTVQLFVQCGMCKARMPIDSEADARALLRAHLYCEHGAHVDDADGAEAPI